jgi:hypothetical protein
VGETGSFRESLAAVVPREKAFGAGTSEDSEPMSQPMVERLGRAPSENRGQP